MFNSSFSGFLKIAARWIVYGLAGIILIFSLIFSEKERFIAPVLKKYVPELIAARGGPSLRIGNIDGNYLSEIDFQSITLDGEYPSLNSLKLSSVKLVYSLLDLLSGPDVFLKGLSIEVSKGQVEINLDSNEKSRVASVRKPEKSAGFNLPRINADDLSVKLIRTDREVELRHGRFEVSGSSKEKIEVNISVPEMVLKLPHVKQDRFSLETGLLISKSEVLVRRLTVNGSNVTRSARVEFGGNGVSGIKADFNLLDGRGTLDYHVYDRIFRSKIQLKSINIGKTGRYLSVSGLPEEGIADINLDITGNVSEPEGSTGKMHIYLKDVKVGERRIDEADATIQSDRNTFLIENAVCRAGENRIETEKLRLPLKGLFEGKIFEKADAISGHLNVFLGNVPEFLLMTKLRPFSSVVKLPEHEFFASVDIYDGIFHIKKGRLKSGGSVVNIKRADIPLFPGRRSPDLVPVSVDGSIRVEKLKDITDILALPMVRGRVFGDISISGTLADPNASFLLHAKNISREGISFDSLDIDGKVEQNRVTFSKIEALNGSDKFSGNGSYDKLMNRFGTTVFSVNVKNVSVYKSLIPSGWLPDAGRLSGTVTVSGPLENPKMEASVSIKKWKYPKISIFSGAIRALVRSGKTDIKHFAFSTSEGDLAGSCSILKSDTLKPGRVNLLKLTYRRKGLDVKLLKPAAISLGKSGDLELKQISFAGAPARVDINGRLTPEWKLDLNLTVTDGTSDGVPEEWIPPRIFFEDLNFKARLTGTFIAPKLSVSGEVKKVGTAGGNLYLRGLFGFELSRAGIYVSQFNFSDNVGHRINLGGRVPFKSKFRGKKFRKIKVDGDISIDEISDLSGLFFSPPHPTGSLVSRVSIRGTPDEPSGELHIHTKNLNLPVFKNFPFVRGVTGDIDIHMDKKRLNIDKVSLASDELDFSASGSWIFGKTFEQILNGEKLTLSDSLDTSGDLRIKDIGLLTRKVSGLRRLEGAVTVNGHLSGPIAKPLYSITLFTEESKLKTNTVLPSFSDIKGKIVFENDSVAPELAASLGGSPVALAGTIFIERKPHRFNIRFEGDNILYYRKNGLKIRGNTSLHLSGDSAHPELRGEIALTESKFVKNVDLFKFLKFGKRKSSKSGISLFSFKSPPFKDAKLDIVITSEDPFVIKNNFIRGTLRPELRLKGTGEIPVLEGKVYIDPTVFQLPYGKLKVTGGYLRFLETSPDKPTIDLNAEGRLLAYDIFLHAEGPYNEPVVTLSSVPPLPEDELLLLVLAGELPKGSAAAQKNGIGLNVAVYLSRSLLLNLFQSDSLESDGSILERFDVEIGRNVTEAGAETVEAQFFIDRNIMGRQEEWFLTSERDRFDDFNSGLRVVFKFK